MKHYELKYEFVMTRFLGCNKDFSRGYFYDAKNRRVIDFDISKNRGILKSFLKLVDYVRLPSRREKYLGVYKILELLDGKPSIGCRAVRVSIAHSANKVTDKKLVDFLLSNFGELDISFRRSHQSTLFYRIFTELVESTYSEMLANLDDVRVMEDRKAKPIMEVLDYMRSEHTKDAAGRKYTISIEGEDIEAETGPCRIYDYPELEELLKEYVPNRFMHGLDPDRLFRTS